MDGQATEAALDDDAKIRATVADYQEGWYFADAARMERSLRAFSGSLVDPPEAGLRTYPSIACRGRMTIIPLC